MLARGSSTNIRASSGETEGFANAVDLITSWGAQSGIICMV